jgi:hypothetical protein
MPAENQHKGIFRALQLLLRPVMRFCLRHSLKIQEISEATKVALLEAAEEELRAAGEEVNVSRLMVISGIHRRDITRIVKNKAIFDGSTNLITRILGQWQGDRDFRGVKGPRVLSCRGESSEFAALVRKVSKDVHHTTVLFELQRLGLVEESARGLRLVGAAFVPAGDPEQSFSLLEQDVDALIRSAEENILSPRTVKNLHGRTEYDGIRADAVAGIRKWLFEEGSRFHKRAREYLSKYDLDLHPDKKYRGKRFTVILGAFGCVLGSAKKPSGVSERIDSSQEDA